MKQKTNVRDAIVLKIGSTSDKYAFFPII